MCMHEYVYVCACKYVNPVNTSTTREEARCGAKQHGPIACEYGTAAALEKKH